MTNRRGTIHRRDFLGGLTALGISTLAASLPLNAELTTPPGDSNTKGFEAWLNKIKGKHRQVFDAPSINGGLPIAWPRVFVMTNEAAGAKAQDVCSVLVLRHDAIPLAMNNSVWEKYKFSDAYKPKFFLTQQPMMSNLFWGAKEEDFPLPGLPLDVQMKNGLLVAVCDMALTVDSQMFAKEMKMDAAEVKKDWVDAIFPGIQLVPSGVLAINRAQEHGCTYCYAGEG